jgi:hypothetical protein
MVINLHYSSLGHKSSLEVKHYHGKNHNKLKLEDYSTTDLAIKELTDGYLSIMQLIFVQFQIQHP